MQVKIMNVDPGNIVIKDNCKAWIGKSTKRKGIINKMLDKFCLLDFGEVSYMEKFQNDFIVEKDFTSFITLIGRYPLNDGTGEIVIKRDRKDNIHEVRTKIDFIPIPVEDPIKIREGNLIKFDFAR